MRITFTGIRPRRISRSQLRVDLIEPIQVMILYGTVMATEAGPVKFFDDIYGHDRQLATLLGI